MTDTTPTATPAGRRHPGSKLRRVMPTSRPRIVPEHKPSAVLRSSAIERWQPTFERAIGGVLLGLSIAGTIALFNGAWGQPRVAPFFIGLAVQSLLTFVEWLYRRRRLSWQYLTALGVDVLLSVAGYSGIIIDRLAGLFGRAGAGIMPATALAWLVLLVLGGLLAYIPERILVED